MTVHLSPAEAAPAIIRFWFEELSPEQHWRKAEQMDREIERRFGAIRMEVLADKARGWRDSPDHVLAAILLLDQFSRNIHRGKPRAFEADPLARELSRLALERGWVDAAPPARCQFLLMPLMHSEDLADQERSLEEFAKLDDETLHFARLHHDQIARFGRFPGRNAALGRQSTAEEQALIDNGKAF